MNLQQHLEEALERTPHSPDVVHAAGRSLIEAVVDAKDPPSGTSNPQPSDPARASSSTARLSTSCRRHGWARRSRASGPSSAPRPLQARRRRLIASGGAVTPSSLGRGQAGRVGPADLAGAVCSREDSREFAGGPKMVATREDRADATISVSAAVVATPRRSLGGLPERSGVPKSLRLRCPRFLESSASVGIDDPATANGCSALPAFNR